jgi:hypothetical protein
MPAPDPEWESPLWSCSVAIYCFKVMHRCRNGSWASSGGVLEFMQLAAPCKSLYKLAIL